MIAMILVAAAAVLGQTNSAEESLEKLLASEWERTMEMSPTWASSLGDRRFNDRWEDLRRDEIASQHARDRKALQRLSEIDRTQLTPRSQLTCDLFRRQYERRLAAHPFGYECLAVHQREGIQTADELSDALRFETKQDYEDWIARCRRMDAYMEQTLELLRDGMRRKIVQPKVIMQRVPAQIEKQLVESPTASPFYKPLQKFPRDIEEADRALLRKKAEEAIREVVVPAYRRMLTFIRDEYLPVCFDEVGAWQLPQGKEFYANCCQRHTTTDLTPDQIHELGLNEVARIRRAMEQVKEQAGFQGSLPEFFQYLRTDPKFFCKTEQDLLETYQIVSKRIDPHLVKLFRTLPRIPYGVEAIPMKIAPDTTTAYYRQPAADGSRAGTYFVNLFRPETRPKWEMMALSLHEAVPGHHLQIALATEQTDLPPFRRYGEYTAYVEGWALYAESLGDELGLYDDPYSKFGQLTYEMWRAVRLVVDTGIHHKRWSREQAIEFFRSNAPKMENDIVNEIDRYIAWPGQALAYKIGELKIKELRRRGAEQLQDKFDVKEFHDVILRSGSVPLDVLEAQVNGWLAGKK